MAGNSKILIVYKKIWALKISLYWIVRSNLNFYILFMRYGIQTPDWRKVGIWGLYLRSGKILENLKLPPEFVSFRQWCADNFFLRVSWWEAPKKVFKGTGTAEALLPWSRFDLGQGLQIIPRHPEGRLLFYSIWVFPKGNQVIEGVCFA